MTTAIAAIQSSRTSAVKSALCFIAKISPNHGPVRRRAAKDEPERLYYWPWAHMAGTSQFPFGGRSAAGIVEFPFTRSPAEETPMTPTADIGLIGLAVMGENLALNIESRGYTVAVFNRTTSKVDDFVNGRGQGQEVRRLPLAEGPGRRR